MVPRRGELSSVFYVPLNPKSDGGRAICMGVAALPAALSLHCLTENNPGKKPPERVI